MRSTDGQIHEGERRKATSVKSRVPLSEPAMSQRYASRAVNARNARPVISPSRVMAKVTTRKTIGSVTHVGRPVGSTSVKKMSSLDEPSMRAGKKKMKAMSASTATGA